MNLEKPLSRVELEKLDKLLASETLFEKMVEQATRGRKLERRRAVQRPSR